MILFWWLALATFRRTIAEPTQAPEECQPEFVRFGDQCYYIAIDYWLQLDNAMNTCRAMRSNLVGIETLNEFNFLTREIEKRLQQRPRNPFSSSPGWRKQFWTSGNREEMGWSWRTDGSAKRFNLTKYQPMVYEDWYPGEPSEVYEQGITAMYRRGQWGWNDHLTVDNLKFICEVGVNQHGECPENFRRFNRSCYLFVGDQDMGQAKATLYCNSLRTHLVAIQSQEEWDFIKRSIEEYVEASGNALVYEQWWTGGVQTWYYAATTVYDVAKMLFTWDVTISQIPGAKWFPYHPLANPSTSYLTLLYKDEHWYWLDEPRDSSLRYICEYRIRGNSGCKRGWIEKEDKCYLIPRYATKSRHGAEVACMKSGARLVSINSRADLDFIISRLSINNLADGSKWWTGGLPMKGHWVWSDNYALFSDGVETLHWSDGEPNNWDDMEDRLTLALRDGQWGLNDVPHESHILLPFICESKLNSQEDQCRRIVGRKQITRLPRTGGTWANLILNSTFTCPGRVSKWRYYRSNTEFSVYAGVWRPVQEGLYMLVGQVEFPAAPNGATELTAHPITVLPGDVLGIHYPRSAEAGAIAHAIAEDRAVDQKQLSSILVLELNKEDLSIGETIDASLHTISGNEQCLSIHAVVAPTYN